MKLLKTIIMFCLLIPLSVSASDKGEGNMLGYKFDFKEFYTGKTKAQGVVLDWRGKQIEVLNIDMKTTFANNDGELHEIIHYSDQSTKERIWKVNIKEDGSIKAQAPDIEGDIIGKQYENICHIKYNMLFDTRFGKISVHMDDWSYRIDKETIINTVYMSKFGIPVGKVFFIIKKG